MATDVDVSPEVSPIESEERPNEEIECTHSNKGCNWRGQRNMLQGHINWNQRYEGCEYVEFNCIHECGSREKRGKLKKHEEDCLLRKTVQEHTTGIRTLESKVENLQQNLPNPSIEIKSLKESIRLLHIIWISFILLVLAVILAPYLHNSVPSPSPSPSVAASSCAEILGNNPNSPSGYFQVRNVTGHIRTVYCDMTKSCGGITGGWMRVATLNMSNSSHQCPKGLTQFTDSNVTACAPSSDSAGCTSVLFHLNSTPYSKVCGRILGGDILTCDGFMLGIRGPLAPLDLNYVDGVVLTHGSPTRSHIWTFAARPCPCGDAPNVVGSHYFCDGGRINNRIDYTDTIWDGEYCNEDCCTFNNPPWFYRQFEEFTTDDIEMRVCRDQHRTDEDVIVKVIDIYVQ